MSKEILKISIVVPVFNVENDLKRCVNSLISQSYSNIEILLIDDGSTDMSLVICKEYEFKDKRVKVICQNHEGVSAARNKGIKNATGEYCMFVDSDDYIETDACEKFIECLKLYGENKPDIILGEFCEVNGNDMTHSSHLQVETGKFYSTAEYIERSIPAYEFYLVVWAQLYRLEYIRKNELYFVEGIVHEDVEWIVRCFLCEGRVVLNKYSFYRYIRRMGSITTNKNQEKNINDTLNIYMQWRERFLHIEDEKLKKVLMSLLVRHYIYNCSLHNLKEIPVEKKISANLLLRYAKGIDRIKAVIFVLNKKFYYKIFSKKYKDRYEYQN